LVIDGNKANQPLFGVVCSTCVDLCLIWAALVSIVNENVHNIVALTFSRTI
jgi:hypothetical protein